MNGYIRKLESRIPANRGNCKYWLLPGRRKRKNLMQSRLYKAIAAAETIHALKHLEIMNGIGSTLDNLKEAAWGI